jgi:hydrogenase maturation factor
MTMSWTLNKYIKYKNKRTVYNGITYHSQKEARFAALLDMQVKLKQIKGYERQVRIPLIVNNTRICVYIVDFVIMHIDNTLEYIDVKGYETPEFRLKWKLFNALYIQGNENVRATISK